MKADIELIREAATALDFSSKTKGVSDCADLVAFLRDLADRMEKAEPVAWIDPLILDAWTNHGAVVHLHKKPAADDVPLFTHPAKRLKAERDAATLVRKHESRRVAILEAQLSAIREAIYTAGHKIDEPNNRAILRLSDWQTILNTINQQENE